MRKNEILDKLKAERELSKEILSTLHLSTTGGYDARASLTKKSARSGGGGGGGSRMSRDSQEEAFFITEEMDERRGGGY